MNSTMLFQLHTRIKNQTKSNHSLYFLRVLTSVETGDWRLETRESKSEGEMQFELAEIWSLESTKMSQVDD